MIMYYNCTRNYMAHTVVFQYFSWSCGDRYFLVQNYCFSFRKESKEDVGHCVENKAKMVSHERKTNKR